MYRLYDFLPSGNGYKVRLLLRQLEIPFEHIEKNIIAGETRTPDFLAINANGRIPVLEVSPGQYLAESNAILYYLSQNTAFFPDDPWDQAQVMRWLFFEQYSHEPHIATSRYWLHSLNQGEKFREQLDQKRPLGYAALQVMEDHLKTHTFFVNESYSIADIALYAYTHVADEGGFDLSPFTAIQAWFARVKTQPNHCLITDSM
ncbi:glutathione S-transferase family protein [Spirulina major]|uniref:glutathione S-transferase family protein n=1 Tax=Spirulina major TaxID=270636 RepID=UPI00093325E9|nr:glutathione S-transferase family protein [Spirulina major]